MSEIEFDENKLYRISQVARLLGVHTDTVRRWANIGLLKPQLTVGGHRRFLGRSFGSKINYVARTLQD